MKKILLLKLFLLLTVVTFGQTSDRRMTVSIGTFSASASPSWDYQGAVGVTGSTGFTVDDLVAGEDFLFDANSRVYRVDSIDIITPGVIATLWVTDIWSNASAPLTGKGNISQGSTNYGMLQLTENGSAFITEEQEARMLNYNFQLLDSLAGSAGGAIDQVLYVSKSRGNNATAEVGNPSKPWADPFIADLAAGEWDMIHVLDGVWTVSDRLLATGEIVYGIGTDTLFLGDGRNSVWQWEPRTGLTLQQGADYTIYYADTSKALLHYGKANYVSDDDARVLEADRLSNVYFEADSVSMGVDANWGLQFNHSDADSSKAVYRIEYVYEVQERMIYLQNNNNSYFDIWIGHFFSDRDDDAFRIVGTVKGLVYNVRIDNLQRTNPQWGLFDIYRSRIDSCSINWSVGNYHASGNAATSQYAMLFSITEGDYYNSSINMEVENGSGYGKLGYFSMGYSTGSTDSLPSNSSMRLKVGNFKSTDTYASGRGIIDFVNITDSMNIDLDLNIESNLTVPVRIVGNAHDNLTIKGNLVNHGAECIKLQGPTGSGNGIYLKDLSVRSNHGGSAITSTLAVEVYTAGAFDHNTIIFDPDITFTRLQEYGAATVVGDSLTISWPASEVYYISPEGNDGTAVKNDPRHPWKSLKTAANTAPDTRNVLFYMLPGEHLVDTTGGDPSASWYYNPVEYDTLDNFLHSRDTMRLYFAQGADLRIKGTQTAQASRTGQFWSDAGSALVTGKYLEIKGNGRIFDEEANSLVSFEYGQAYCHIQLDYYESLNYNVWSPAFSGQGYFDIKEVKFANSKFLQYFTPSNTTGYVNIGPSRRVDPDDDGLSPWSDGSLIDIRGLGWTTLTSVDLEINLGLFTSEVADYLAKIQQGVAYSDSKVIVNDKGSVTDLSDTQLPINNAPHSGARQSFYDLSSNLADSTIFILNIDKAVFPKGQIIKFDGNHTGNSQRVVNLGYGIGGTYFYTPSVTANSRLEFNCTYCENDANYERSGAPETYPVVTFTTANGTGDYVLSGTFVSNDTTEVIAYNSGTGRAIFKDMNVSNILGGRPAISGGTRTIYTSGVFDRNTKVEDPDITFIRLDEYGQLDATALVTWPASEVYYISPEGNDGTAEKNNPTLPWKSLKAAALVAPESALFYLLPGEHLVDSTGGNPNASWYYNPSVVTRDTLDNFMHTRDTMAVYFAAGSTLRISGIEWRSQSTGAFFWGDVTTQSGNPKYVKLFGPGTLFNEAARGLVVYLNPASEFTIQLSEYRNLTHDESQYNTIFDITGDSWFEFDRFIFSHTKPIYVNAPASSTHVFIADEVIRYDPDNDGLEDQSSSPLYDFRNGTVSDVTFRMDIGTFDWYIADKPVIFRGQGTFPRFDLDITVDNIRVYGESFQQGPHSGSYLNLFFPPSFSDSSVVNIKLGNVYHPTNQIMQIPTLSNSSIMNISIDNALTSGGIHFYNSNINDDSQVNIYCGNCVASQYGRLGDKTKPAPLITYTGGAGTGTVTISGTYVNPDTLEALAFNDADKVTILRDVKVKNAGTNPAIAGVARTIYTAGAFDHNSIILDPDITFTKLSEYGATGDGNGIISALPTGNVTIATNNILNLSGANTHFYLWGDNASVEVADTDGDYTQYTYLTRFGLYGENDSGLSYFDLSTAGPAQLSGHTGLTMVESGQNTMWMGANGIYGISSTATTNEQLRLIFEGHSTKGPPFIHLVHNDGYSTPADLGDLGPAMGMSLHDWSANPSGTTDALQPAGVMIRNRASQTHIEYTALGEEMVFYTTPNGTAANEIQMTLRNDGVFEQETDITLGAADSLVLVHKKYVDAQVGGANTLYTADGSITSLRTVSLSADLHLNYSGNNDFEIDSVRYFYVTPRANTGGNEFYYVMGRTNDFHFQLYQNGAGSGFVQMGNVTNYLTFNPTNVGLTLSVASTGFTITDSRATPRGLTYNADYGATQTARDIPDLGKVRSEISDSLTWLKPELEAGSVTIAATTGADLTITGLDEFIILSANASGITATDAGTSDVSSIVVDPGTNSRLNYSDNSDGSLMQFTAGPSGIIMGNSNGVTGAEINIDENGYLALRDSIATPTGAGSDGDMYYNSTSNTTFVSDGTKWIALMSLQLATEGTTTINANKSFIHPVNVSGGTATVNPPSSPVSGDWFAVSDSRGNAGTQNITVDFTTATQNLHGSSQNYVMNADNASVKFLYVDATVGWIILD